MPIYNGNIKQKELYYGGTKIKEAYYGSTRVYNSRPLYYCYFDPFSSGYRYLSIKPTSDGNYTVKWKYGVDVSRVTSSSQLRSSTTWDIICLDENTFYPRNAALMTCSYYPDGDLYT